MKFFNNNKNKSFLLSATITILLTLSGCSNGSVDTIVDDNLNVNILNIDNSNSHKSSLDKPLDISSNNKLVVKATIDRVVDGDTVEIILSNGDKVDTRLLLIDTPETKHPKLGVQKYGPEASEFAKSVLHKGDPIYFELDGKSKTDKYGRYLGYLWYTCKEHNTLEMYNERVVEEGLARVGYIYSQTKYLSILLEAQDVAKSKGLNIWSIPGYVTDKGYNMDKINK
ncbi:MAG: thermonuclease family protein [Peptostreptococcaceae bacterium]